MEFITLDMFLSLAGCVVIVTIITQALKQYFVKINPLWLNFFVSLIIGILRIIIIKDFDFQSIVVGISNIFVIMLAAGGTYDTAKSILKKEE